ncbi:MAG TPA: PAS domain-containing protein [Candidatus Acidoferrales bacterium]|nr:PAS domain-containing protein [Candidatus Acidoferrales bacterium]
MSTPKWWTNPPSSVKCTLTLVSVAAAVMSAWVLWHFWHSEAFASVFFCAVIFSAWFGGFRQGLLGVIVSTLAFDYFFLSPNHSLYLNSSQLPRLIIFLVSALIIGFLTASQRSTTVSLRLARDELSANVQELEKTNNELRAENSERKLTQVELRRSQAYLAEAQRLSHTGSFGWRIATGEIIWSQESFRIFQYDPATKPTLQLILQRVHPEDTRLVKETVERASEEGKDFDHEYRLVMPDTSVKYVHVVAHATRDESESVEYVGAVMDITSVKEAEDRTRRIIDTVPAQLWTETPEGAVNFVNRRWIDYTGMTLEQAVGSGWNHVVHPDDLERVRSQWRKRLLEGKPGEIESRLRRSDGDYRWFLSRVCPLVGRSGEILGWYGSDTDIHDLKEAEESLRRSEGYLAEAQRLSHTGSWASIPAAGEIRYMSEECYRVLGYDPRDGEPRYEMFFQNIHPDDQAKIRDAVETAGRENAEFELDYRIGHPGGEIRDIHAVGHPVLRPSGELVEFVGTVMDVTDRKRGEEKLRQSEAYLRESQRLGHIGSWAYKVSSGELFASAEFLRIFGRDPEKEKATVEMFRGNVHPEDREFVDETINKAMREKTEFALDHRVVLPDGSIRHVYSMAHRVFDNSDTIVDYIGTVMDVTDRKRAEEALRRAQSDLAHVNRVTTMGELTASLAHEVNQPIAAAITNANTCVRWLTRDDPDLEEARAAAMRIVKDGTRAAEIVSRIRQVFKKSVPERESVDVNDVIREMIVLLRGEATKHRVSFHTELAAMLPRVMGDRLQLQQVVMNLIVNSIDAMKDMAEKREIVITSQRMENEHITVSISDNGMGLPPQQEDQIFNAFFTTKPHGTGMGLRICRSIVESHGGRLSAANSYPRGATFSFTIPSKSEAHE